MIGKSGTGASFRGLANYLEQEEKLEWRETRNVPGWDRDQDIRLMEDTASMSRAEKPVYHLSVSYDAGDNPSKQMMLEDADELLEHLGLADHQTVIASHKDEDFKHIHLMVNRVHEGKDRAWNPWQDRQKYRPKLREIEQKRGYRQVLEMEQDRSGPSLSKGEYKRKQRTGEIEIADRKEVAEIFERAESWKQLQGELSAVNLQVKPKGRGGVVEDSQSGYQMKLSRVGREHSFGKLEKRFGRFQDFQERQAAAGKVNDILGDGAYEKAVTGLNEAHGWMDLQTWEKDGLEFRLLKGGLGVKNTDTGKSVDLSEIDGQFGRDQLDELVGQHKFFDEAMTKAQELDFYSDKLKKAFTKAVESEFSDAESSADAKKALTKVMKGGHNLGHKVRDTIREIEAFSKALSAGNPALAVANLGLNIGKKLAKQLSRGMGL